MIYINFKKAFDSVERGVVESSISPGLCREPSVRFARVETC